MEFAKCLVHLGAKVTITTTISAHRRIAKSTATVAEGHLTVAAFSDNHDDGVKYKSAEDMRYYGSDLKTKSYESLREIIITNAEIECPITCVIYGLLQSWAGEVAKSLSIIFALLWINAATILDIYRNYFNGYEDVIREIIANGSFDFVELLGLPWLFSRDLPSFLLPMSPPMFSSVLASMKEQVLAPDEATKPGVLVNTFNELEPESLKFIGKYNMAGIGPLIPSALLDQKDQSDRSFVGDLQIIEWLNLKPESSVIYVSFGSMLELPKEQMEEIAYGLLESERPFLWVIIEKGEEKKLDDNGISICIEELRDKGIVVPWCSQLEVLSHPSLGCFITHCGWNSTLESLINRPMGS